MISLRAAFCAPTTTRLQIHLEIGGHYDEQNRWVPSRYGRGIKIPCTPLPLGDQDHGTYGETLKAEEQGERRPAGMKFSSLFRLPINAVVVHDNYQYKITREGNYSPAGFWAAVGYTDTTAHPIVLEPYAEYPPDMTIQKGQVQVPITRLQGAGYGN